MSNLTSQNPLVIDTIGVISATALLVESIVVRASADVWVVVLHDAASGNKVFEMTSSITNDRGGCFHVGPTKWAGIYATTLTNITSVQVNLNSKA